MREALLITVVLCGAMAILTGLLAAEQSFMGPRVQAYVYTSQGCPPCERMKKDIPGLQKDGWKVACQTWGDPVTAHIVFDGRASSLHAVKVRSTPTIVLYRDGKEVRRIVGYVSAKDLAEAYNAEAKK